MSSDGEFWERVPQTVTGESVTVKDLVPGAKYKFRVRAENTLGQSDPCETDKSIIAKNPYGNLDSAQPLRHCPGTKTSPS